MLATIDSRSTPSVAFVSEPKLSTLPRREHDPLTFVPCITETSGSCTARFELMFTESSVTAKCSVSLSVSARLAPGAMKRHRHLLLVRDESLRLLAVLSCDR